MADFKIVSWTSQFLKRSYNFTSSSSSGTRFHGNWSKCRLRSRHVFSDTEVDCGKDNYQTSLTYIRGICGALLYWKSQRFGMTEVQALNYKILLNASEIYSALNFFIRVLSCLIFFWYWSFVQPCALEELSPSFCTCWVLWVIHLRVIILPFILMSIDGYCRNVLNSFIVFFIH